MSARDDYPALAGLIMQRDGVDEYDEAMDALDEIDWLRAELDHARMGWEAHDLAMILVGKLQKQRRTPGG